MEDNKFVYITFHRDSSSTALSLSSYNTDSIEKEPWDLENKEKTNIAKDALKHKYLFFASV
jgi:hypothetical protein